MATHKIPPSGFGDLDKALPASIDAERFILGSILLDDTHFLAAAEDLTPRHFALDKHQTIFRRMIELHSVPEKIDHTTLANHLLRTNELESVDGLGYLVSLQDGMPHFANIDSYIRMVVEKYNLREAARVGRDLMQRAIEGNEDAKSIISSTEYRLADIYGESHKSGLKSALQIVEKFEGRLNGFLDASKRTKGTPTGFTKLDEMTGGFRPGELIILAARPSVGKTALALNIAWHFVCIQFQPVAIFSLEMSDDSLLSRMVCAAARVDNQRFRSGHVTHAEKQKLRDATVQLVEAPIYIDDTANITDIEIHGKLKRKEQAMGRQFGLVIVDYLQLMGGTDRSENRNQEVSKISRSMKILSKELGCPFLVLSQLSRGPETRQGDHRPQLADLRESGSIEQDADVVGFIFREEMYKQDREDLRGLAELIIAKQRNGPIGKVDLVYQHGMTKFENRAPDYAVEPEG